MGGTQPHNVGPSSVRSPPVNRQKVARQHSPKLSNEYMCSVSQRLLADLRPNLAPSGGRLMQMLVAGLVVLHDQW